MQPGHECPRHLRGECGVGSTQNSRRAHSKQHYATITTADMTTNLVSNNGQTTRADLCDVGSLQLRDQIRRLRRALCGDMIERTTGGFEAPLGLTAQLPQVL
jgi:hypothetical protein